MKISNIFVTGSIQSGKSTVINCVLMYFAHWKIKGFQTIPIDAHRRRSGFIFKSMEGEQQCFAHIDFKTSDRLDIYHFDLSVFEDLGVRTLDSALHESDLIIMDEIGVMERNATKFRQRLIECLDSPIWVLGAVQQRATWFHDILRSRRDTWILTIDETNRDTTPQLIIERMITSPGREIKF